MIKLQKFEDIKLELDNLEESYLRAKDDDNKSEMDRIDKKYSELRIALLSNFKHFKDTKRSQIKKEKSKYASNNAMYAALYQKRQYKKNKSYVYMVNDSLHIDDYIENKPEQKKKNFIMRTFKTVAITGVLAAALLAGCKNGKDNNNDLQNITETTKDPNSDVNQNNVTSNVNSLTPSANENNNSLNSENVTNVPTPNENNNSLNNENVTNIPTAGQNNGSSIKPTITKVPIVNEKGEIVVETPLDPHVTNGNSEHTTHVNIPSVTEPTAQKRPLESNDKENSGKEKVDYEYKEEKEPTKTENIPIEEEKEPTAQQRPTQKPTVPPIPSNEHVTYEEVEVTVTPNVKDIPIEEEKKPTSTKKPTPTPTDKVTYEDLEVTTPPYNGNEIDETDLQNLKAISNYIKSLNESNNGPLLILTRGGK